jgi:hydroxymethylpyrimidine pyrophosphatase-like HAD family hydrolase
MGKPFKKELERTFEIYNWASDQPRNDICDSLIESGKSTLIVGSGGSLSACHYLALLLINKGIFAKAITPLEVYYSRNTLNNSNIVFLSASGKNTDIMFGFNLAMQFEPNCIISICMKKGSPLAKLSQIYSNTRTFEYNIPTGKDGFLATNSLVAFFSVLYHSYKSDSENHKLIQDSNFLRTLDVFFNKITKDYTFHLLYGGFGQPVSVDIESKFTEAGLANTLLSDYRNFGHGRHHWFDKKRDSAIIALVTPEEKLIAKKTLALLPEYVPHLVIESNFSSPLASIDLLIKSFHLVNKMGEIQSIDPGRPGVPDFGSKLYHLKYSSFYTAKEIIANNLKTIAILRKAKVKSISEMPKEEQIYWSNAYDSFLNKLSQIKFGSIIFDYDGTLCSIENRFGGLSKDISAQLIKLLSNGILIGIVTGRGQSARKELQSAIPQEYWKSITIGYYNGSDISSIDDNNSPNKNIPGDKTIIEVEKHLKIQQFPFKFKYDRRPYQLTIEMGNKSEWERAKSIIVHFIMKLGLDDIQILESSHSIDITTKQSTSKLNIIPRIKETALSLGLPENFLCIGDKGLWPGNDFELLSTPYSLSVDEVSSETDSCWNLSHPGIKNYQATLEYFNLLKIETNYFTFNYER